MNDDTLSLHLLRTLRRGWRLIAACAVLALVGALGASALMPRTWKATAVLTVEPISALPSSAGTAVNMNTERVVATSTEVLRRAGESVGEAVSTMRSSLEVTVPKGAQALEFSYTGASAQDAANAANAVATAYNEQRVEGAEAMVASATQSLAERITVLQAQLDELRDGSGAYEATTLEITALQERRASLTAATFYPGTLVSPAAAPSEPTNPSALTFAAGGLAFGLIGGLVLAVLADRYREARATLAHDGASDAQEPSETPAEVSPPIDDPPAIAAPPNRPLASTNRRPPGAGQAVA